MRERAKRAAALVHIARSRSGSGIGREGELLNEGFFLPLCIVCMKVKKTLGFKSIWSAGRAPVASLPAMADRKSDSWTLARGDQRTNVCRSPSPVWWQTVSLTNVQALLAAVAVLCSLNTFYFISKRLFSGLVRIMDCRMICLWSGWVVNQKILDKADHPQSTKKKKSLVQLAHNAAY